MKHLGLIMLGIAALIVFIYEVIAFIHPDKYPLISVMVWDASRDRVVIPFGAGFLCGHLFWPEKKDD